MTDAVRESAVSFACGGQQLLGIVTEPADPAPWGVLILVGGPQYRVGSHRQFTLLARRLAAAGYAAMRFDYRGMGDSGGHPADFEAVEADVAAALAAFQDRCPAVRRVVLWGLCDAASSILLYCRDHADSRLAGLCLLNPWARSAATLARTQVKHYYGRRLLDPEFWKKLFGGGVNVPGALAELAGKLRLASRRPAEEGPRPFQVRMAEGLARFDGPVLLVLSGDDYTAKEFLERTAADRSWAGLLERPGLTRVDLGDADHTFSSARHRAQVEDAMIAWLAQRCSGARHEAMG